MTANDAAACRPPADGGWPAACWRWLVDDWNWPAAGLVVLEHALIVAWVVAWRNWASPPEHCG